MHAVSQGPQNIGQGPHLAIPGTCSMNFQNHFNLPLCMCMVFISSSDKLENWRGGGGSEVGGWEGGGA